MSDLLAAQKRIAELEREVTALVQAQRGWIIARDGGRHCEICEQEIRRGEAYIAQPGTGGLAEHVLCPKREVTRG